jgi:hypothetical protein
MCCLLRLAFRKIYEGYTKMMDFLIYCQMWIFFHKQCLAHNFFSATDTAIHLIGSTSRISTGRFIVFSVITNIYNNIYNKNAKGPTVMELFRATGKVKTFFDN